MTGPGTSEVTSPGYPGRYSNNLDTSTPIQVQYSTVQYSTVQRPIQVAEGSRIELSFADMDIEDEDTCSYDYVSGQVGIAKPSTLHAEHSHILSSGHGQLCAAKELRHGSAEQRDQPRQQDDGAVPHRPQRGEERLPSHLGRGHWGRRHGGQLRRPHGGLLR